MVRRFLVRWLLAAVLVPVAAAAARRVSRAVETRRGPSGATRMLSRTADTLQRFSRR